MLLLEDTTGYASGPTTAPQQQQQQQQQYLLLRRCRHRVRTFTSAVRGTRWKIILDEVIPQDHPSSSSSSSSFCYVRADAVFDHHRLLQYVLLENNLSCCYSKILPLTQVIPPRHPSGSTSSSFCFVGAGTVYEQLYLMYLKLL